MEIPAGRERRNKVDAEGRRRRRKERHSCCCREGASPGPKAGWVPDLAGRRP